MRLTILLLLFFTSFYAQNKITIAYQGMINLGKVDNSTHFYFTSNSEKIHLKGTEINSYSFSKPGTYHLKVEEKKTHNKESCTDIHLPKDIIVEVSRVKMVFDDKNMALSSPIIKNQSTAGIALRIPVAIETYDHLPAVLNRTTVSSAGIGTNITATLDTALEALPEGTHTLLYALNGTATENAYLVFDFVDANAQIQSIPLLTPVKN